jgi:hypothetical protein
MKQPPWSEGNPTRSGKTSVANLVQSTRRVDTRRTRTRAERLRDIFRYSRGAGHRLPSAALARDDHRADRTRHQQAGHHSGEEHKYD